MSRHGSPGYSPSRPELAVVASHSTGAHRGRRRRRQMRLAGLLRLLVFLLLIFVAVWAGVRVANASGDSRVFQGQRYEVRTGDTLWSIAAGHYGDSVDLREAVYDMQRQNRLSDGLLQPGQEIVLPYEGAAGQVSAP